MLLPIRASDRRAALRRPGSGWLWNPDQLPSGLTSMHLRYLVEETRKRLGARFREGVLPTTLRKSAITLSKGLVLFALGFLGKPRTVAKELTKAHELGHVESFRKRPARPIAYALDKRVRWVEEMACIAVELRLMRAMDARCENMIRRIDRAVASFAKPWPDGYGLGTIPNLAVATCETLMLVVDGKA